MPSEAETIGIRGKSGSLLLQSLDHEKRQEILRQLKQALLKNKKEILKTSDNDFEVASKDSEQQQQSLLNRLKLSDTKFQSLLQGLDTLLSLEDPLNVAKMHRRLDDGLVLRRITTPVGVLLVIFEARPEVYIQICSLAIKSGNAVILKGGKEAKQTLTLFHSILQNVLQQQLNNDSNWCVQLLFQRDQIPELLHLDKYIDLVIPRGSNQLVQTIKKSTTIPVLGHADGICSIYIDKDANLQKSIEVLIDAKTSYPAACNSVETLLLHQDIIDEWMPLVLKELSKHRVQFRLETSLYQKYKSLSNDHTLQITEASKEDFDTEFSDLILAVKPVSSLQEAINHINHHGSKHTDAILTDNQDSAHKFFTKIDSAGVYWNASTRFADGFRYGFGAEVGVSTSKTHARGPVGLEGLLSYKYLMEGQYNTTKPYDEGSKKYKHEDLMY
ncbi:hypothetical protein MP638_002351 [Amoeboaphelidium occidentale]|nr:hypothetical protein MP638_002351 [Amoeboaphelidium occidentale]